MSKTLVVHGLETSNTLKVRVALGYKGIEYAFATVDPNDRSAIVRISGQHLTPVVVHGDRVVFDSASILRYLDVTFPKTPRLFGRSRDEQWEIEDHELFARSTLAGPMMAVVHGRAIGAKVDDATVATKTREFHAAVATLAERLRGREWLVGDSLTAADATTAPVLFRIRSAKLFEMPAAARELEPWVARVMAFDGRGRRDA